MKYFIISFIGLFIAFSGFSQTILKGKVQDQNSGKDLIGASVVEKSTGKGAFVSSEGFFTLETSTSDSVTVEVKFTGYQSKEVKLLPVPNTVITLEKLAFDIDETIITAINQKRVSRDLGYTVQKLKSKELDQVIAPNFVDNITGKVAGVVISQGATGVGSSSKITIRGETSFTNNNPLFIIDGMPISNSSTFNFTDAAAAGFQETDFGNGAMAVNPNDVESITVLKGPSAAALYGTRAANGVIIINTKTGASAKKGIGVSFNSTTSIETPFALPQFQNRYGQGNSGQFKFVDGSGGGINDNITYSWGPELDQGNQIAQFDGPVFRGNGSTVRGGDIALYTTDTITPTPFISHPNNLKDFYKTGVTRINNIALSHAFNTGSIRVALTDLNSNSYIPGVDLTRRTLSTRLHLTPNERLEFDASINYINGQSDNRPSNGYGSENINYSLVAWGPRSLNVDALKDYWQPGLVNEQQYSFNYTFFDNPYFILKENRNSFNRNRLFGNISARYKITPEISISMASGLDNNHELRKFRRHFSTNRFHSGAYAEQDVSYREVNTNFLINYSKDLGFWAYDISFGGNRLDQFDANKQSQTLSLAQPGIFNFSNAAAPIQIFQFERQKRINSFYAFGKVRYKNFLYIDITARNDWSSALATSTSTANTSFIYPSISASFIVSEIMKLPNWVNFAKIRTSYAQVGNDTDPYQTAIAFEASTPVNGLPTFTLPNSLPNANLLPEKTGAVEIGADVRMFNNRVKVDFTYYNSLTKNQIVSLPTVISSGFNEQVVNGGAVRSKGIEIILATANIRKKHFRWESIFNFSRNISSIESLPIGTDKITLGTSSIYDNVNQTVWFQLEEGGRIGDMYGTGYLKNENGKFVIDENGRYIADNELQKLGNYNPDFILGIGNQLRYKNFNLNFLLDWRQGGILVSRTLALAGVAGQLIETESRPDEGIIAEGEVNTGTEENPVWVQNTKAVTAEQYYRQYYDRNHEENNTYNATYLKLRQFSLGYTFNCDRDRGVFQKDRVLNISIIGRNLFAFSYIPHFDPEQLAVQGNQFVSGVEDMSYPTARSIGIRIGYQF